MNKNFQTIALFIFGFFLVVGVVVFALQKANDSNLIADITVWGTIDSTIFEQKMNEIGNNTESPFRIKYKQFREDNFDSALLEALASGAGPDVIVLSQDRILKYQNKVLEVPFSSFSERRFRDDYIEGAEIFLTQNGILAFPIMIDPLVMYWNRDILSNAGITKPPVYWDEIYSIVKKVTDKDNQKNLKKETIAFGEFINVNNAKEIISALIMQTGNQITKRNDTGVEVVLGNSTSSLIPETESAIRFYTEFSNPSKDMYTWNRSLNNSLQEFLSGNLAFYIGFTSEVKGLREKNPNLNFDVAKLPQIRGSKTNKTFANMNAIAIMKSSPNANNILQVIGYIISNDTISILSNSFNIPPIKRELLMEKQQDAYKSIFYDSAIIGRAWLDPNPNETTTIFKDMIENVTSGKLRINQSVSRADTEIQNLLK
ncbi:MAG: extracellular solute-binding protein [Candidatus Paceibacterota bacterium]